MRNIVGWPTETDALQPITEVRHGGKTREIVGLSLSRSLPSSHHAQVKGVGGLTQATGAIRWAAQEDVTKAHVTAFNRKDGWPPRTGDAVWVSTGYRTLTGDKLARQLLGTISETSGDPQASIQSTVVDLTTRLTRKVNLPPLLNNMPPLQPGGPWRGVGLYPTFFTDRAARAGGFYSTPPRVSGCVLSAPLMGSAWPEQGVLYTGLRSSDRNNANAIWGETPWGMGASDAFLSYTPSSNGGLSSGPMELTAMCPAPPYTGRTYLAARWGTSEIRLNFLNGQASGIVNGVTVCSLSVVGGGVHTLRVTPVGGDIQLALRDAAGREATGTAAMPAGATGSLGEVWVLSDTAGAYIGGVLVSFAPVAWQAVAYTRTAYITPAAHNATLAATPPIKDVSARTLLEEQSQAELAALWIDGDGALRWVNRSRLVAGNPVTTLTSKDHLKNLSWQEEFTAISYQVEVTGRAPEAVLQSKVPNVELWRSNYSAVEADGTEVFEELLHPDTDEDWIMVDTVFNQDPADRARMTGSDVGLYYWAEYGDPDEPGSSAIEAIQDQWAGATLERIDDKSYKLITRVYAVNFSATTDHAKSLKVPSERHLNTAAGWPANLGGMNFPIVRGYAKTMWTDNRVTALTGASADAPVLSHDVGWWVQDAGARQAIANLLATETATPRPFLTKVGVVPDARLERGDIVTLSDPDITGVEFRCLVVGIEDDFSSQPTSWRQTCDFRVLGYSTLTATLAELDAAWAGQLLTALDAARAGESLTAFDNDPLKGAPL